MGEKMLKTYKQGFIDGLRAYAYWKDGIQYVGISGRTLKKAIEETWYFDTDEWYEDKEFCLKCHGEVGHRINCPDGIAFGK